MQNWYKFLLFLSLLTSVTLSAKALEKLDACSTIDKADLKDTGLAVVHDFTPINNYDLRFNNYLIKTSNELRIEIVLFIDNQLQSDITFDSDIRYRYKAFLYESKKKQQAYKLLVMELIARNDDSDEVEKYYLFLIADNKVIKILYINEPIYDYYLMSTGNYEDLDKHNVKEYISVFIKSDTLVLSLHKKMLKLLNNRSIQGIIEDKNNFYLCKKLTK